MRSMRCPGRPFLTLKVGGYVGYVVGCGVDGLVGMKVCKSVFVVRLDGCVLTEVGFTWLLINVIGLFLLI